MKTNKTFSFQFFVRFKDPLQDPLQMEAQKVECFFLVGHHNMRINNRNVETVKVKYVEPWRWFTFTKRVVQPVEPCVWEEAFPWP